MCLGQCISHGLEDIYHFLLFSFISFPFIFIHFPSHSSTTLFLYFLLTFPFPISLIFHTSKCWHTNKSRNEKKITEIIICVVVPRFVLNYKTSIFSTNELYFSLSFFSSLHKAVIVLHVWMQFRKICKYYWNLINKSFTLSTHWKFSILNKIFWYDCISFDGAK